MALSASRLSPLLAPRSVAIVGASPRENTLGNNVVMNLRRFGYAGRIFPVHPSAPEVAGLPAYPALAKLPEPAECAVLAVPADKIAAALEEGVAHGLRAAVVFASGFAELGVEGRARQRELQELCTRTGIVLSAKLPGSRQRAQARVAVQLGYPRRDERRWPRHRFP